MVYKGFWKDITVLILAFCLLMVSLGGILIIGNAIDHRLRVYRTDYHISTYKLYLFSNQSIENITIYIPLPDDIEVDGEEVASTIHGSVLVLHEDDFNQGRGCYWLTFSRPLQNSNFTTQEGSGLWMFSNNNDSSVKFHLVKTDWYCTRSLFWEQVEYSGLMNGSYGGGFVWHDEDNIAKNTAIPLKQGWNKYEITMGESYLYLD